MMNACKRADNRPSRPPGPAAASRRFRTLPDRGAVKRKEGPPVIGVPPARRGRLLGWWARRRLPRPGNAIDLVRLTVWPGSWATIYWRWRRAAHASWRSHPAAGVACSFLGVELVSRTIGWLSLPSGAVRNPPLSRSPVFGRGPSRTWRTMRRGRTMVPGLAMRRNRYERLLQFRRWPIERHQGISRQCKRRATHGDRQQQQRAWHVSSPAGGSLQQCALRRTNGF